MAMLLFHRMEVKQKRMGGEDYRNSPEYPDCPDTAIQQEIRFRVKTLARPERRPDGVRSAQFRSCGFGGWLGMAGCPAWLSRRRLSLRNHRSLSVQMVKECETGAPPGQASPGAGGKMRPFVVGRAPTRLRLERIVA